MSTQITVKTKIKINGQEYASVDDMPADVRRIYERAMATIESRGQRGATNLPDAAAGVQVRSTIMFNGQEYPSADAMPADVRTLYDRVMATLAAESSAESSGEVIRAQRLGDGSSLEAVSSIEMSALVPESSSARWLIAAGLVIVALLLALFALR
jgi:hypothetical protein